MEENKSATSFKVGGELFAVNTKTVRHILENSKPTPVPLTKPFVKGIINNHGTMIPVVDFRTLLGREQDPNLPEKCIIVLGIEQNGKEEMIGFIVDEMDDVFEYSQENFTPESVLDLSIEVQNAVFGTIKHEEKFVCLLKASDLAKALL